MQVFAAVDFVRRDADILNQMILLFQIPQVLGDDMGLEAAGTPAAGVDGQLRPRFVTKVASAFAWYS